MAGEKEKRHPTEMASAYRQFRPMLFHALSLLAKQGFVASPGDGLDLIHDFFVEEWEGVALRFDPKRGELSAYVYQAFLRFARARIVKLQRLERQLVRSDEIDRFPAKPREPANEENLQALRSAVVDLPKGVRDVVLSYFGYPPRSERQIARELSLSRYRVRERLVEGLGRIVTKVGKPSDIPDRDWQVAIALWRDARTVQETTDRLGVTAHQVREAQARNIRFLEQGLGQTDPKRSKTMKHDNPADLLAGVLESEGDQEKLEELRNHAKDVIEYLEKFGAALDDKVNTAAINRDWLAEVYGALAGDLADETATTDGPFAAHAEEDAGIGVSYWDALVPDLPDELSMKNWLVDVALVPEDERAELLESPAVQGIVPAKEEEVQYMVARGVTPLTVHLATEAVSAWLRRAIRKSRISEGNKIRLEVKDRDLAVEPAALRPAAMIQEIANMTDCEKPTAEALSRWLVKVAERKPYLFRGFEARNSAVSGVELTRSEREFEDLAERWMSTVEEAVPVEVGAGELPGYLNKIGNAVKKLRTAVPTTTLSEQAVEAAFARALVNENTWPFSYKQSGPFSPDFVFGRNQVAVDVRVCLESQDEGVFVQELTKASKDFQRKYTRCVFVVYDEGHLKDVEGLKQKLEFPSNVTLEVVGKRRF